MSPTIGPPPPPKEPSPSDSWAPPPITLDALRSVVRRLRPLAWLILFAAVALVAWLAYSQWRSSIEYFGRWQEAMAQTKATEARVAIVIARKEAEILELSKRQKTRVVERTKIETQIVEVQGEAKEQIKKVDALDSIELHSFVVEQLRERYDVARYSLTESGSSPAASDTDRQNDLSPVHRGSGQADSLLPGNASGGGSAYR